MFWLASNKHLIRRQWKERIARTTYTDKIVTWRFGHGTASIIYVLNTYLYPWLGITSAFPLAIEQSNLYLDVVRRLVAISFSRPVTSCAFTSFVHENGLQPERNLYCIGLPTVRNFDTPGWISQNDIDEVQPSPGCSVIVLPLFHPGVDKHIDRSPGYIRLLMLTTYEINLYVLSIAHRIALNEADREREL